MEKNRFIENFKKQFEEDNIQLDINTEFRTVPGWDSMTSLMVVAMFDEIYNTNVTSEDLEKSKTILDLFNLIK